VTAPERPGPVDDGLTDLAPLLEADADIEALRGGDPGCDDVTRLLAALRDICREGEPT
jgi:hypothetical protein